MEKKREGGRVGGMHQRGEKSGIHPVFIGWKAVLAERHQLTTKALAFAKQDHGMLENLGT